MGRGWGGGGQFTSNLGPRWMGLHHTRGGIPSKQEKGSKEEEVGKGKLTRDVSKGNCAIT